MRANSIHISWNEITTVCIDLFRSIPIDIGHAEDASICISRMETWSGNGLEYIHQIYNEITPRSNMSVDFLIKRPHLLIIKGNHQTLFKISDAIDFIKVHTLKHGYVVCHIHDFKHEKILPSFLYKKYTDDIDLSAQVMSKNILTVIQNVKTRNNPQIAQYSMPNNMESQGMITIHAYDNNHFKLFHFQPTKQADYILHPDTLKQRLLDVQINGLYVDEKLWDWTIAQSKKILIPESEKSKLQAG